MLGDAGRWQRAAYLGHDSKVKEDNVCRCRCRAQQWRWIVERGGETSRRLAHLMEVLSVCLSLLTLWLSPSLLAALLCCCATTAGPILHSSPATALFWSGRVQATVQPHLDHPQLVTPSFAISQDLLKTTGREGFLISRHISDTVSPSSIHCGLENDRGLAYRRCPPATGAQILTRCGAS